MRVTEVCQQGRHSKDTREGDSGINSEDASQERPPTILPRSGLLEPKTKSDTTSGDTSGT